jgi:hypothetical protein
MLPDTSNPVSPCRIYAWFGDTMYNTRSMFGEVDGTIVAATRPFEPTV